MHPPEQMHPGVRRGGMATGLRRPPARPQCGDGKAVRTALGPGRRGELGRHRLLGFRRLAGVLVGVCCRSVVPRGCWARPYRPHAVLTADAMASSSTASGGSAVVGSAAAAAGAPTSAPLAMAVSDRRAVDPGHRFTRAGALVVSVVQEGLMRVGAPDSG